MSSDDAANPASVLDALIPGDGKRWPAFSAAVDLQLFVACSTPEIRHALAALGDAIEGLAPTAQACAIAAWEEAEPLAFAALLRAAQRSYYTAPRVLATVAALADAAPREPSPIFDPDLVARVIETNAGRRRL
jgi:hypothetical protein